MPLYNVDFLTSGVITMTPAVVAGAPTPPAPPVYVPPAPTPAPPAYSGSLIPRQSTAISEIFSSPRNNYVSGSPQPNLPLVMKAGTTGQYNGFNGRDSRNEFQNCPFIVTAELVGQSVWFDWWSAANEAPGWASVSRVADDYEGLQGASLSGLGPRSALANNSASFIPQAEGLYYWVFKLQTPGSGNKFVRIAA